MHSSVNVRVVNGQWLKFNTVKRSPKLQKNNSFSAEQKLISSVISLTLLPTVSFLEFLEVKGHIHI